MRKRHLLFLAAIAMAIGGVAATRASATTIIPLSDEDLTASAAAIVEGRCVKLETAWDPEQSLVFTYVTFNITAVHKGNLAPGRVVIKQIGGSIPDRTTVVWGAPYWALKWRMMLFLTADDEGALRVAHWSLGYYRILSDARTGAQYVVRPETGARVLSEMAHGQVTDFSEYDAFVERVDALVASAPVEARSNRDLRATPSEYDTLHRFDVPTSNFTFLKPGFRWFEPDSGAKVRFALNPNAGPTPSNGRDEATAAALVWSSVPGSSLRVELARETTSCGLLADGTSSISFGDCRDAIDNPVNCSGVVALGGITQGTPSETKTIGGQTFNRILDADIVFNNGFDCLLSNPFFTAEIMTHEMGHTLGLGHSSEAQGERNPLLLDATMFFIAHNDARGASLRDDDQDAIRFVYRSNVTSSELSIVTSAVPDIQVGAPFSFALRASGTGPFTWSVVSGQLPTGLSLSSNGVLSGTSPTEDLTSVTVSVRDAGNFEQTQALTVRTTNAPAPFIDTVSFKAAGKLTIKGVYLTPDATVTVNEVQIAPPRTVKFKAAKGVLVIKGASADLNVRVGVPNRVVVTIGGRSSNTANF